MLIKKPYLFFVSLLFCGSCLCAQDYNDDAALWLGLSAEKKIEKIDISLDFKNRIGENFTQYQLGYLDLGLGYNLTKNVKILVGYKYGKKRRLDESYNNRHRFYAALILKKKINKFTFLYRNLVQMRLTDVYSSENGSVPTYYERNKLTVKYELNKRITTYLAEELYLPFYQAKNKGLSRSRTYLGLLYDLSKRNQLDICFLYQQQLNSFNKTNRDFVYCLSFTHEF